LPGLGPSRTLAIYRDRSTSRSFGNRIEETPMSHHRSWGSDFESLFNQHGPQGQRRGGEWGGPWGSWQWGPPSRRSGPPPWLAGLFGLVGQDEAPRGPRVRRGDVRVAILAVLAEEPLNGYQVIQQISERTDGAWRPSPGSVYPTISQLEDEGLIEGDDERGRRTLRLSDDGRAYLASHAEEVAEVWAPFEREGSGPRQKGDGTEFASLKPEVGRVMNAVWQIISTGTEEQRRDAIGVLVEARRALYRILADHPGDDGEVDVLEEEPTGEEEQ
jgi:DNA-binding PadR family transcriptional regulator